MCPIPPGQSLPVTGTGPRDPAVPALSRRTLLTAAAAALAACGLPQQGPRTPAVIDGAAKGRYTLIDVDARITALLGQPPRTGFGGFSTDPAATPTESVGIGDTLEIRILEAGAGGLFAAANGGAGGTSFPGIVVNREGRITLPYIGQIDVAGQTPSAIETRIVDALRGKAIEPQALVRIAQSDNNSATVSGDVANPGPVPLSLRGTRLSQAISGAGGSRFPAHETRVTLVRRGRSGSASLADILLVPANDIALQRDDLIVLAHEPPRYTLTGSVGSPGAFEFPTPDFSVLEAIAAAGGASDQRADATGVFLFRHETPSRLATAGQTGPAGQPATRRGIPTVYRFDMSRPDTQFHAQDFLLADGDALLVSSAGTVQLDKVLSLFNVGVTATNRAVNLTD